MARLKVPATAPVRATPNPSSPLLTPNSLVTEMFVFPSDPVLDVGDTDFFTLKGKAGSTTGSAAIEADITAKIDEKSLFATTRGVVVARARVPRRPGRPAAALRRRARRPQRAALRARPLSGGSGAAPTLSCMSRARAAVGVTFLATGALHFLRPRLYEAMMPRYLPAHRELIYASGAAELAGGAGILHSRTARLAGWWLIATLVAIFPANVEMALHAERFRRIPRPLLWVRLPFQGVLVAWVWRTAAR